MKRHNQRLQDIVNWPALPGLTLVRDYHLHADYIAALVRRVKQTWQMRSPRFLVISFHGIPKRYVKKGDPYEQHCQATATAIATSLQLNADQWVLCYQSQFGYDKWLSPSTPSILM